MVRVWEHDADAAPRAAAEMVSSVLEGVPLRSNAEPDWRVEAVDLLDVANRLEARHLVDLRNAESSAP